MDGKPTAHDYLQPIIHDVLNDPAHKMSMDQLITMIQQHQSGALDVSTLSAKQMKYLAALDAINQIEENQNAPASSYSETAFLGSEQYYNSLSDMIFNRAKADKNAHGAISPDTEELIAHMEGVFHSRAYRLQDGDLTQQTSAGRQLGTDISVFDMGLKQLGLGIPGSRLSLEYQLGREGDNDLRLLSKEGGGVHAPDPLFSKLINEVFPESADKIAFAQSARSTSDMMQYINDPDVREAGILNDAIKDLRRNGMIDDKGNINNPEAAAALGDIKDYMRSENVQFDRTGTLIDVKAQDLLLNLQSAIKENRNQR